MLIVSENTRGHNGAIDDLVFYQKDSLLYYHDLRDTFTKSDRYTFESEFPENRSFFNAGL